MRFHRRGASGCAPARGPWRRGLLSGLVLGLGLLAAGDGTAGDKDGGMFGFLKGRKDALAGSRVASEVGAALTRQNAFPAGAGAAAAVEFGDCREVAIQGQPPAARFVERFVPGESVLGYRVGARGGVPPLALRTAPERQPRLEVWELSSQPPESFVKARPLRLAEDQPRWFSHSLLAAACLPGSQLVLAVRYVDKSPKDALFVLDTATGQARPLGRIETDLSRGLPPRYFDLLPINGSAALLRFGSDWVRVAAETYANGRDHVVLFTPRHPQGLEVLSLSLDDGNVRRWALVGKTLWLETEDIRPPGGSARFVWSLDLAGVLY
jgi:hypothetical protein